MCTVLHIKIKFCPKNKVEETLMKVKQVLVFYQSKNLKNCLTQYQINYSEISLGQARDNT